MPDQFSVFSYASPDGSQVHDIHYYGKCSGGSSIFRDVSQSFISFEKWSFTKRYAGKPFIKQFSFLIFNITMPSCLPNFSSWGV
jgi:hypothetical protein